MNKIENKDEKIDGLADFLGIIFSITFVVTSFTYLLTEIKFYGIIYIFMLFYFVVMTTVVNYKLSMFNTYNENDKFDFIKSIKRHSKVNFNFLTYHILIAAGLIVPFFFDNNSIKGISTFIALSMVYQLTLQFKINNKFKAAL